MKDNITTLNTENISSEVFIIAPIQIDTISKNFGNAVAEAMNVRPLANKIRQIAYEILTQTLHDAKKMGEQ